MKTKFKAREIVLMALPALVIVGVARWRTQGGSLVQLQGVPLGMDKGLPRLKLESSEPLELTLFDASQGFVWGRKVILWEGGEAPFRARDAAGMTSGIKADIFFRQKGVWKKAQSMDGWALVRQTYGNDSAQFYGDFITRHTSRIKVRIEGTPPDATEIRLKGFYRVSHRLRSSACGRVTPGKHWKFYPSKQCAFQLESQSFDWPIKTATEPRPQSVASHQSPLQLVDAKWIVDSNNNYFVLQMRRSDGNPWKGSTLLVEEVKTTDEKGKPLLLGPKGSASFSQDIFSARRLKTDLFVPFAWPDAAYDQSYEMKVKGPLTLRAKVSDGQCWPLDINVRVPRVEMKLRDFGAA